MRTQHKQVWAAASLSSPRDSPGETGDRCPQPAIAACSLAWPIGRQHTRSLGTDIAMEEGSIEGGRATCYHLGEMRCDSHMRLYNLTSSSHSHPVPWQPSLGPGSRLFAPFLPSVHTPLPPKAKKLGFPKWHPAVPGRHRLATRHFCPRMGQGRSECETAREGGAPSR